MTHVGCLLWIILLITSVFTSLAAARHHHASPLAGLTLALLAWLTLLAAYATLLSLLDHRARRLRPDLITPPKPTLLIVWLTFLLLTLLTTWSLHHLLLY